MPRAAKQDQATPGCRVSLRRFRADVPSFGVLRFGTGNIARAVHGLDPVGERGGRSREPRHYAMVMVGTKGLDEILKGTGETKRCSAESSHGREGDGTRRPVGGAGGGSETGEGRSLDQSQGHEIRDRKAVRGIISVIRAIRG